MAVRKRGNTWIIDYRVNGKKIVRAVGPCKRDAVAAEGKIKAQIREGRFFDCKPRIITSISELIQRYREDQRGKRSAVSEAFHLRVIEMHFGSGCIIQHLDRAAVDAFLRARRDTPTQYGRPRSTALNGAFSNLPRHSGCDYVFTGDCKIGHAGKPFHDVRTSFENACKRGGIFGCRFHDLRHTAASHMVMVGVPLRTVGEILGHSTLAMAERYSHLLPEHKLRAVEMLPDWGWRDQRCEG